VKVRSSVRSGDVEKCIRTHVRWYPRHGGEESGQGSQRGRRRNNHGYKFVQSPRASNCVTADLSNSYYGEAEARGIIFMNSDQAMFCDELGNGVSLPVFEKSELRQ